jgi:hypothetical protein
LISFIGRQAHKEASLARQREVLIVHFNSKQEVVLKTKVMKTMKRRMMKNKKCLARENTMMIPSDIFLIIYYCI